MNQKIVYLRGLLPTLVLLIPFKVFVGIFVKVFVFDFPNVELLVFAKSNIKFHQKLGVLKDFSNFFSSKDC